MATDKWQKQNYSSDIVALLPLGLPLFALGFEELAF
jgi:hypothetical protein